ncbi:MAG: 3-methyl-2-oxobutanoate hydroxymethyltransferase [Zetaproteobacteria bacterium CG_4_9_14_3_um_filter_49_83]|nr:MAG: 3-methyl-2-oxobutanoate hydroxymethyltransferase [Zetaproteobacteria bacterium CG1_02_49_23]PIQ31492.1 MAG: 3-methyl-2-oxobutanoate hydroxymethyltransferase [Zetaproteobacteria bacterium CG17_big_fil_post_rev_8_21_14_2_50_50_13]PIV29801.1 MAG: 3-methyl-2-oxobutanoate hydroxymethyltransferase [Zetaproteobacteria bacterium CG02_land_8_20_14_3_00_50_9]PIY54629.1 MAG: 3-methyl-2-oxobutanoate hydroxymethyltransferase [Zetaproteobacteria bacterium CG_4_10_14_0_8_um_filter_49_80]PJA35641.1 MAG
MKRTTAATLAKAKANHEKTVWLTACDTTSAQLAEAAGVDVLLVGDSLGMVALGFDSTIPVTLEHMIHHTAAVVRGHSKAWVVCDLPFGSYQQSPEQAFASSVAVLQQSGCDAVKLEGGVPMAETIRFLSERGIAVVAHIGLTPQSVKKFGSYRARGTNPAEYDAILADAQAVTEAGAVALVLECIPAGLAQTITNSVAIPTVGIGAGGGCDSQVLVWHDVLGLSLKNPSFAPAYCNLREQITTAIEAWSADVRSGAFPK